MNETGHFDLVAELRKLDEGGREYLLEWLQGDPIERERVIPRGKVYTGEYDQH